MYPRDLVLPDRSFFLFGPRGTGKTTWLRAVLPDAHWIDLLSNRQLVRLTREPDRFGEEEAYAENSLTQEIRQEALVKRLDSFTRFLEVAALANAQVTNVSAIARDAAVARPTVQA